MLMASIEWNAAYAVFHSLSLEEAPSCCCSYSWTTNVDIQSTSGEAAFRSLQSPEADPVLQGVLTILHFENQVPVHGVARAGLEPGVSVVIDYWKHKTCFAWD